MPRLGRAQSARAPALDTLSWRGGVIGTTAAARGLANLGVPAAGCLDCGPVASTDPATGATLVWPVKILQRTFLD